MFHIVETKKFPEERARFYAAEILTGLCFLHANGIIYRLDVKVFFIYKPVEDLTDEFLKQRSKIGQCAIGSRWSREDSRLWLMQNDTKVWNNAHILWHTWLYRARNLERKLLQFLGGLLVLRSSLIWNVDGLFAIPWSRWRRAI